MSDPNPFRSPKFLEARSAESLKEKMLENNLTMGVELNYFSIQQLNDGNWIAWFYLDERFFRSDKKGFEDKRRAK